jgi:hypothetical protein
MKYTVIRNKQYLGKIIGGKKACSVKDAAIQAGVGGLRGAIGGISGAVAGAIWGAGQCVANNFHGVN